MSVFFCLFIAQLQYTGSLSYNLLQLKLLWYRKNMYRGSNSVYSYYSLDFGAGSGVWGLGSSGSG